MPAPVKTIKSMIRVCVFFRLLEASLAAGQKRLSGYRSGLINSLLKREKNRPIVSFPAVISGALAVPCTRNPLYAGPNSLDKGNLRI